MALGWQLLFPSSVEEASELLGEIRPHKYEESGLPRRTHPDWCDGTYHFLSGRRDQVQLAASPSAVATISIRFVLGCTLPIGMVPA